MEAGGGAGDSTVGLGRVLGIKAPMCFSGSNCQILAANHAIDIPRFSLIASGGWIGCAVMRDSVVE